MASSSSSPSPSSSLLLTMARPSTPSAVMRAASLLRVQPRVVEFRGFELAPPGAHERREYVANVQLQNASDRLLRVRVAPPPPASAFRVLYQQQDLATTANPTLALPAGLGARLEVVFTPPPPSSSPSTHDHHHEATGHDDKDPLGIEHALIHDALQVHGDDGSWLEVPLVARRAFPEIELIDGALCDLGLVVLTHRAAKLVRLRNTGQRPGRFDVEVLDGDHNATGPGPRAPMNDGAAIVAKAKAPMPSSAPAGNQILVSPVRGVLRPGQEQSLKIEVLGNQLGGVRGVVRLRIRESRTRSNGEDPLQGDEDEGDLGPGPGPGLGLQQLQVYTVDKIIDVSATVMEHGIELVHERGRDKVERLLFGSLLAGESRTIETVLRNNGPQPVFYHTTLMFGNSIPGGGGSGAGASMVNGTGEEDREAYERRKELQVFPAEGRVEPFGEQPVTFTYHPRSFDVETLGMLEKKRLHDERVQSADTASNQLSSPTTSLAPICLNAFASIQCAELQAQNLTFEIAGKAFLPKLEVTPLRLDFGDIRSHERVDMLLSIKNLSGLPVRYVIPRVAQFATKPSMGRLDLLQSQTVVVSFVPSQLGKFRKVIEIVVNENVIKFPVHVCGNAAALGKLRHEPLVGGPLALPTDFAPKYKFILADDAKQTKGRLTQKFHRMAPYELAALNGTAAVDEFEFQGTNNTHLTYCVKELAKRDEHRSEYHEYLSDCHQRRQERSKRKSLALKETVSVLRSTNVSSNNDNDGDGGNERIEDVALDLGMDKQSGLEPKMLRMPRRLKHQSDPLWLDNQQDFLAPNGKSKMIFDENKFVKKKFKAQPATQAELADCGATLTFDQLEQIASGPKTIHFGKLSVNGVGKKSLTIMNALTQNVSISLHLSEQDHFDELGAKTPLKSQVIPPKTMAGFDLHFSSNKEQFFQKALTFTINGIHTRQVTIVAEVAPIVVDVSTSELVFQFSSMDTNPTMAMEFTIANTSDSVAPFVWSALPPVLRPGRPDSSKSNATAAASETGSALTGPKTDKEKQHPTRPIFEVIPTTGVLGPTETVRCQVMYTPPSTVHSNASYSVTPVEGRSTGQWLSTDFQLGITGGRKVIVSCKALFQDVKYLLKDKKVDFGTISVGMEKEKRINIANTAGSEDGYSQRLVFYASIEPQSLATAMGLSVSPSIGSILPQDSCDLQIKISPHKPAVLENVTLNLHLRGGKTLKVPIASTVLIPDVQITQPSFDYGDVMIGVTVPRVVSLENRSTISACLIVDLVPTLTDEFWISLPPKLVKNLEDVSSVFIPMLHQSEPSSIGSDGVATSTLDSDTDSTCSRWQICIPPNTTISFHLNFTPKGPRFHDALFPIQFAGLQGSGVCGVARPPSITRHILAQAKNPRLLFSSATFDFHRCVITREGIRKVPYTKTLVLTNNDSVPLRWQIDASKFKAAAAAAATQVASNKRGNGGGNSAAIAAAATIIFHVAPEKGELTPGEEAKVRVSFLPMEAVEYIEDEVPLLVDDTFYINIGVRGVGIHPHLSFSENKIVLPTVPLGIPSVARFFIHSTGYDHLELTFRLPLDVSKAPISLSFPKGKIVSMACPKIPCDVRFSSKRSVAFNARIEFFDSDGNVFHLPIAGCTENCIITNHDFVSASSRQRSDAMDTAPLQFYTHPTYRYPVYLITGKQIASEGAKYRHQKERAAIDSSATTPGTSNQQQIVSATNSTNGFIEVDANTMVEIDSEIGGSSSTYHDHGRDLRNLYSEQEVRFLLQYLNSNFLRTAVTRFPHEFAENQGKPLYELLEMVCTKKPPSNAIVGSLSDKQKSNATSKSSATTVGSAQPYSSLGSAPTKREQLQQYTSQYNELLKYLKSYGAMLHDVLPEHLLSQDLYIRACEDPRADPAVFTSAAMVGMKFLQRRHALEKEWIIVSTNSWMKVLYQVLKCFLLYRITQKSYHQQHSQYQLPSVSTGSAKTNDKQESSTAILPVQGAGPRFCQGSNVYSEAEMVLVQWVCDHVRSKLGGNTGSVGSPIGQYIPESRLLNVGQDLLDGRMLFHVLAAHIPTLSVELGEYRCFRIDTHSKKAHPASSLAQAEHSAQALLQVMTCFGVDFGLDPKRFLVAMNAREITILLLHLYQMLPQFIPKATIEFKGVLGQVMEKTIELKNPSNKIIRYQVFLDGSNGQSSEGSVDASSSDFSIESNQVILEPGKTVSFLVTFRPKFSHKVTARLVFQSIRETALSNSSGATMVFLLESNITARKPVRIIQIETSTYEKKTHEIVIENQFLANANYKLSMSQSMSSGTMGPAFLNPTQQSNVHGTNSNVGRVKGSQAQPGKDPGSSGFGRRNSNLSTKEDIGAEHTWCVVAQQPFYLPEFGASVQDSHLGGPGIGGGAGSPVITMKSQGSSSVKLDFLPLSPGNYKCQLLFLDEKVGEFVYEVHATAHLPLPLETIEYQCELPTSGAAGRGSHFLRELVIPPRNPFLNKTLAMFVDRANGLLKNKLKEGLKKCEETHHTHFITEFNSPYFSAVFSEVMISFATNVVTKNSKNPSVTGPADALTSRTEVSVDARTENIGGKHHNQARLATPRNHGGGAHISVPNSVLINFQPKSAGMYTCKVLLRSHNAPCGSSDWRVYDLVVKVKEPNVKTLLEFAAPARQNIVQDIPLANPSETAWTLKATFAVATAGHITSFSGPASIHVPAKKTVNYPLSFSPKWISQEKTSLTLMNPTTQQQFEFELTGYGEEPLAQDHVVLRCQARTSVTHTFEVVSLKSDPHGPQTYKVESDLRDVVGASTITIPNVGGSTQYALTFSPKVSGTYFGSITFTNVQTSEYVWYTIEATVEPPSPEATLDMTTTVRGAIGVAISLENPLDHSVVFSIELQGTGLLGQPTFALDAKASGVYELVYSPLLLTEACEDGAILFANDEIGQFWYRLNLTAEPAPVTALDEMSCAVGDVCSQPILLLNPSDVELALNYRVTNSRNFSIKGSSTTANTASKQSASPLILPPFGQASAIIEYTPSSLSEYETTNVVFFMPGVVSDWEFVVRGRGTPPSLMKPIFVTSRVLEAASTLFTFKNPFADPLRVDVKLVVGEELKVTEGTTPVFDILLRKPRVALEGFGNLQVPISFLPQFVCEAHAEIIIQGLDDYSELEWRYPIQGVAEAPLHPKAFVLACQARESIEKILYCELLAAPPGFSIDAESISVEWDIDSDRFGPLATAGAIERSLTVTPLIPDPEGSLLVLPYMVHFDPLRPYRGSIYLILHKKSGGKWRFEVQLDVGDPPVDDLITIESTLNQTSSITFQLRNQFRAPAPFRAEFSAGSSSAFTVYPQQGTLPPYGSDQGFGFVVSFTPTGYGKMQSGQLVISTEEMHWTFNVKGTYPDAMSASAGSKSLSSSASRVRLGIDSTTPSTTKSGSSSPGGGRMSSKSSQKSSGKRS